MKKPTDEQVEAAIDALCMVLNELADGQSMVGAYVHAKARVAFEPFRLDDCGDLVDL